MSAVVVRPLFLALVAFAVAAQGYSVAESTIEVHPTEFFSKACSGQPIGISGESGAVYRCESGLWTRQDVPLCSPDPPSGPCSGAPLCQGVMDQLLYFCSNELWSTFAPPDCPDCVRGPAEGLDGALVRFDGASGIRVKSSSALLTDAGDLALAHPLAITSGGTGATTSSGARSRLGAADDSAVVHLSGDESVTGTKSFLGHLFAARTNGVRQSQLFPSVTDALADLSSSGGVVEIGRDEDDPTTFVNLNPAGPSSGRRDSLAIDLRRGGIRFLSSMPEYPSGPAGALEERVPFVFQTRLDDPTRSFDTELGAIGEWNCGRQPSSLVNCPYGNSSWGLPNGSKQYWHSGQCNSDFETGSTVTGLCGGPHILEVRYPYFAGVAETSKPIFAVGSGGTSIYAPDNPSPDWRAFLTMFWGADGGGDAQKANMPMFVFDRGGAYLDGGTFCGANLAFPYFTQHQYVQHNLWVQHDIGIANPAFVVEGTSDSSVAGQQSPMAKFYDRSGGKGTFQHPGIAREAFGFYSHSRLYLGSFVGDTEATERGQFIEWEGYTVDQSTTRLRAAEPTASRDIYLPDQSGSVTVAPNRADLGPAHWGVAGLSGNTVCQAVGLTCVSSSQLQGNNTARACTYTHSDYFLALCRGTR